MVTSKSHEPVMAAFAIVRVASCGLGVDNIGTGPARAFPKSAVPVAVAPEVAGMLMNAQLRAAHS